MRNTTRLCVIRWSWHRLKAQSPSILLFLLIFCCPFSPLRWLCKCHGLKGQRPVQSFCNCHCVIQPDCLCDSVSIHFLSTSTWKKEKLWLFEQIENVFPIYIRLVHVFARYYSSNLTMIACPTGHMFLRLDVVRSAQRLHPGLWHNCAHNFTFHRDKGVPVTWDLLIRSQF